MSETKIDPAPGDWFVGMSQQDEGEPDTFDGTVWARPTAEELEAEKDGEYEADCYLVAERIRHEPYAYLIAALPDLLAALEEVVRYNEADRSALADRGEQMFAEAMVKVYVALALARNVQEHPDA